MKIVVSMEEIKAIVMAHLREIKDLNVKPDPEVVTVTHGQYDEAVTEVTGLSFDLN